VRNAPKIEKYVESHLKTLRGRAILLLHDVQAATVAALPNILDWLDKENARRIHAKEMPIKVIDYSYLLPEHRLVPPALDAIGRFLMAGVWRLADCPVRLWPALDWWPGQV
jgi:hypothetical protein